MKPLDPPLHAAACLRRHPANPVLGPNQVPYPSTLTYNAGVARWQGRYVMVFRNEDRPHDPARMFTDLRMSLGLATSQDGVAWTVEAKPLPIDNDALFAMEPGEVQRVYDPRLHIIDDRAYLCVALDTRHGVRGAILRTDDFQRFSVLHVTLPDNRNLVLFPQRINGRWCRLDRPFPVYSRGRDRFDLWYSSSPDWADWGDHRLVLGVEHVPYANDKIGPAAPPIRTERGWLCIFHAVDVDPARGKNGWEPTWKKRYCAGVALLDLHEPWKVLGMSKAPLIAPEAPYEIAGGLRDHVIFPTGAVLDDDGQVKIYYGAGDAVMCLATAGLDQLLALCSEPR